MHLDGPVFYWFHLHHLYNFTHVFFIRSAFVFREPREIAKVPKPLSSLAKRIQYPDGSTGVTFDSLLIMHENLPRKQGLRKGLEQR